MFYDAVFVVASKFNYQYHFVQVTMRGILVT